MRELYIITRQKTNLVVCDKILSEMHQNSVFEGTEESKSILKLLKGNISKQKQFMIRTLVAFTGKLYLSFLIHEIR